MFHNLTDKIEFPTLINTLYTFESSLYDSYPQGTSSVELFSNTVHGFSNTNGRFYL